MENKNIALEYYLSELELISILSYEVFLWSEKQKNKINPEESARTAALKWLQTPASFLFGQSPRDAVFNQCGPEIISFLKAKLGISE